MWYIVVLSPPDWKLLWLMGKDRRLWVPSAAYGWGCPDEATYLGALSKHTLPPDLTLGMVSHNFMLGGTAAKATLQHLMGFIQMPGINCVQMCLSTPHVISGTTGQPL